MAADKMSVSFEETLGDLIRQAASEEGVTVSSWLASAAHDRIRNRLLRLALDQLAAELVPMEPEEAARLVAEARHRAVITGPRSDSAA